MQHSYSNLKINLTNSKFQNKNIIPQNENYIHQNTFNILNLDTIKPESQIDLYESSVSAFEKVQKYYPCNTINSTEIYRTYDYSLDDIKNKSKKMKISDIMKRLNFYMDIFHLFDFQNGTHIYKDRFLFYMKNMNFPLQPLDNDKEKIVHNRLILYNSNLKNKNKNKELFHMALDNKNNDENNPNNSNNIENKEIINKENDKNVIIKKEKNDNINDENLNNNNENISNKNNINNNINNEFLGKKRNLVVDENINVQRQVQISNLTEMKKANEFTEERKEKEKDKKKLNINKNNNKKLELSLDEKIDNDKTIEKEKEKEKEKIVNNKIQNKKKESSTKIKKDPMQLNNIENELDINKNKNKNNLKENNILKLNNKSNDKKRKRYFFK